MLERHPEWGEKVREKSDGAALLLAVVTVTAPRVMLYRQARAMAPQPPPNGGIPQSENVQAQPPQPPPSTNGAVDLEAVRMRVAREH